MLTAHRSLWFNCMMINDQICQSFFGHIFFPKIAEAQFGCRSPFSTTEKAASASSVRFTVQGDKKKQRDYLASALNLQASQLFQGIW